MFVIQELTDQESADGGGAQCQIGVQDSAMSWIFRNCQGRIERWEKCPKEKSAWNVFAFG